METSQHKSIGTDKMFFKIGEVSDLAELEPYVLRYWESEFPFLRPRKNKTGQRVYTRKDLELILQIKELLYREKYTIAGVRKRFGDNTQKRRPVSTQTINGVRKRLKEILELLNRDIVTKKAQTTQNEKRETQLFF